MTAVCAVDVETDGVHPARRPWEIAMIRRDELGERAVSFFVEIDLSSADPFGLRIGRFYERHPLGRWISGLDREFVEPSSIRISLDRGAALRSPVEPRRHVGAVPNFDTEVLAALLHTYGLTPGWHYHLCDVEAMAVGWIAHKATAVREQHPEINLKPGPRLPWDSDDLSRALGVEPPGDEERHTALGDARWALRLFDAITRDGG